VFCISVGERGEQSEKRFRVREAVEPAVAALIRQILRYELNHNFTEYPSEYGYLCHSNTLNQTQGNHKKVAIPIP
jgi:hypothetical protein